MITGPVVQLGPHALLPLARTVGQSPEIEHVHDDGAARLARPCSMRVTAVRAVGRSGASANELPTHSGDVERPARIPAVRSIRARPTAARRARPKFRRACTNIDSLMSAPSTRSPQE